MSQGLLVKNKEECNFGIYPHERSLEERFNKGILIIDKDAGPTSHQVADFIKEILPISKSGHSGTLDPQVTGVLLVGLGRATRLMEYMLKSNKEYICLCYFHKSLSEKDLEKVFEQFRGEIEQMPPIVSSVKRQKRKRTIYGLELLDKGEDNKYVLFRVACQHGTYIRKLCTDMGEYLGMNAQMIELRRTKAGPLREEDGAIGLDKLRNLYELYLESNGEEEKITLERELKKYILPMEDVLGDFKQIMLLDSAISSVSHGSDLALPGVYQYDDSVRVGEEVQIITSKGELIAMGEMKMSGEDIKEKTNGICVEIQKVFIESVTNE